MSGPSEMGYGLAATTIVLTRPRRMIRRAWLLLAGFAVGGIAGVIMGVLIHG